MTRNAVVSGDDITILQTLKRDGVAVDVSGATKIESRLVAATTGALVTDVVEQANSGGADWSAGVVEHVFLSAQTLDSAYVGAVLLETQVTIAGLKTTWMSSGVQLLRGTIP